MEAEKAGGSNAYGALARLAQDSPLGAKGLIALPYFAGARTPLHDPDARGLVVGLTLGHGRGDVYRALLEAVGYGIRHNIDAMREEGMDSVRILAVGGGTQNLEWMQIVSDIAGIEQHIPVQQIGASYGSALLAGVGAGVFDSIAEAVRWVKTQDAIVPNPENHTMYEPYYRVYRDLYAQTRDSMHTLSRLSQTSTT